MMTTFEMPGVDAKPLIMAAVAAELEAAGVCPGGLSVMSYRKDVVRPNCVVWAVKLADGDGRAVNVTVPDPQNADDQ